MFCTFIFAVLLQSKVFMLYFRVTISTFRGDVMSSVTWPSDSA